MSINYRKDYRSSEQFRQDIRRRTKEEHILFQHFLEWIRRNKDPNATYEDYGIDNSGKLVKKSSCKPDYKLCYNGKQMLLEVKHSPVDWKWTLKVYHLRQYHKNKANILIYWNTGYKLDNIKNAHWGIIYNGKIKEMLDLYPHYKEYTFGNRLCIKVDKEDFSKWVNKTYDYVC